MKRQLELKELRNQIDSIDDEIKALFEKRMNVCKQVAEYKQEHKTPILQNNREDEVLKRAGENIEPSYSNASKVLFTNIMDISKCIQQNTISNQSEFTNKLKSKMELNEKIPTNAVVACSGVSGAYAHIAAQKVFPKGDIVFLSGFEKVVNAVENGDVDFGILPIENSSAGSVRDVYELIKKYDFYINFETKIKIEHCLVAKADTKLENIKHIYSHEQALAQCSEYLKKINCECDEFKNTAMAAQYVADSKEPIAAICSQQAAEEFGLTVIEKGVQNIDENYTRFICISKKLYANKDAQMISISLSIPNTAGSLYRLLTKFAVNDFDMTKIESKPFGNKNFDAIFYIDFKANLFDSKALDLVDDLSKGFESFKFLGNYIKID